MLFTRDAVLASLARQPEASHLKVALFWGRILPVGAWSALNCALWSRRTPKFQRVQITPFSRDENVSSVFGVKPQIKGPVDGYEYIKWEPTLALSVKRGYGVPSPAEIRDTDGQWSTDAREESQIRGCCLRPMQATQIEMYQGFGSRVGRLERDVADLRQQVARLAGLVSQDQRPSLLNVAAESGITPDRASMGSHEQVSIVSNGLKDRKEPQFLGTTRPAFGLSVAKATLSAIHDVSDAGSSDRASSPEAFPQDQIDPSPSTQDPLLRIPLPTVLRLLDVFQDEIESMYPIIDTSDLRARAPAMIRRFKEEVTMKFDGRPSQKDIHLVKVILATALVLENRGKSDIGSQLLSSFEDDALRITSPSDVDLQEAQIFAIMCIYHFQCDEELLAYRSIGIAGRMVLEMGLHRRRSLQENYTGPEQRSQAIHLFWCIYVLDRRWSFGTGLSFVLVDRDMDPYLPEPPLDYPYFRCLVAYGKLCSKVWEAIPQYGSPSDTMSPDTEASLETMINTWFSSIPEGFRCDDSGASSYLSSSYSQSQLLTMRTLLYLRGNYIRCLIHRHHVLSTASITKDVTDALLVVKVSQDSVRAIVNLHSSSDIYARQQVAYNFFLINAISIMLLAVCHAPSQFANTCRRDFFAAIDLVRGFSRLSLQGRRLWSSLRGLVSRLKTLGIMNDGSQPSTGHQSPSRATVATHPAVPQQVRSAQDIYHMGSWPVAGIGNTFDTAVPDMNRMGDDLIGVFDTFGRGYMDIANSNEHEDPLTSSLYNQSASYLPNGSADDFSQYFMDML
ncbi:hypothetical protein JX266_005538 [Neoarthrinium moseri]|nr:hypothetical protein JX266_005538 [Neoarthrinium moseri]